jgi:hypothetical protein
METLLLGNGKEDGEEIVHKNVMRRLQFKIMRSSIFSAQQWIIKHFRIILEAHIV